MPLVIFSLYLVILVFFWDHLTHSSSWKVFFFLKKEKDKEKNSLTPTTYSLTRMVEYLLLRRIHCYHGGNSYNYQIVTTRQWLLGSTSLILIILWHSEEATDPHLITLSPCSVLCSCDTNLALFLHFLSGCSSIYYKLLLHFHFKYLQLLKTNTWALQKWDKNCLLAQSWNTLELML